MTTTTLVLLFEEGNSCNVIKIILIKRFTKHFITFVLLATKTKEIECDPKITTDNKRTIDEVLCGYTTI